MAKRIALLGCGHKKEPLLSWSEGFVRYQGGGDVVRFDHNPLCKPDVVCDLNDIECGLGSWLGGDWDEVHAYEVWEHFGRQGDSKAFFNGVNAIGDALQESGKFILSLPKHDSIWAWGDPDHTRVIPHVVWGYLEERFYDDLGKTPSSDFRPLIKWYWDVLSIGYVNEHCYAVCLRKDKLNPLFG